MPPHSQHMTFTNFGKTLHLRINSATDLQNVLSLNEAHWVATSAPINTLLFDQTFLKLVDTDNDGRINCAELRDAISWLLGNMRDTQGINLADSFLELQAVNTDTDTGKRIHQAATKILSRLKQKQFCTITLDQVQQVRKQIESTPVSEAGVVLPTATDDDKIRQFISDIIATIGGAQHPSGTQGVTDTQLQQFITAANLHIAWKKQEHLDKPTIKTDVMPLGKKTPNSFAAFVAIRDKIEQHFAQCSAVAFNEKLTDRITATATLTTTDFSDPLSITQMMRLAPLSTPNADCVLQLDESINHFYTNAIESFTDYVLKPILKKASSNTLTFAQWEKIKQTFAPHETWANSPNGTIVAPLGIDKLNQYLDEEYTQSLRQLISQSKETAIELDNIRLLEKLILFQTNIIRFANNFVSSPDLYDPLRRAAFEVGSAVLDGRRFNFAVIVDNLAQHSAIAQSSNIFVMYLQLVRADSNDEKIVAVPVTSGGKGNLHINKRGIFEDIQGLQWHAKIIQIIDNPVSLGEAVISPFKRIGKTLTGKIESITTSAEKTFDQKTQYAMTSVQAASTQPTTSIPSTPNNAFDGTMLMGGGVAIAAIMSALTYVGNIVTTNPYAVLLGIGGAILAVILPITILAFIKLRQRDLSAILEGTGWAINARMKLTIRQAHFFTEKPHYPTNARGTKRSIIYTIAVAVAIILFIIVFNLTTCSNDNTTNTADTTSTTDTTNTADTTDNDVNVTKVDKKTTDTPQSKTTSD